MKNTHEDRLLHLDKLDGDDLQELIDDVVVHRFRWARDCCGFSRPKLVSDDEFKKSFGEYEKTKIKDIENGDFGTRNIPKELTRCISAYASFFSIPPSRFIDPDLNEKKFREMIIEGRKKKGEKLENIEKELLTLKHDLSDSPINDKLSIGGHVSFDDMEKHLNDYHQKVKNSSVFRVLERVFTPLEMVENPELAHDSIENVLDLDGDFHNYSKVLLKDQDGQAFLDQQPGLRGDVFELMDQESQLVIQGEPGTGKTTCLQWRCFNFIKNYQRGGKTAIYVPLTKYRPCFDLLALISRVSRIPQQYLHPLLKGERLVLLLDALNECQAQIQEDCLDQIIQLLVEWPDTPLLLTSRVQSRMQELNLPVFTVQSISRENQVRFLEAYLEDTKRAEHILDQLHAQPGGDIIAENPWMLFMISKITHEGEDLPRGRAMMYRRYVQRWYEREFNKAYHNKTDLPWTKKQVFDDLCHIAAHMRAHGYAKEAPLSWLIGTLGSRLTAGRRLLDFLGQGMICIINQEDDIFGFAHETLQEYLSAEYVLKKPELLTEAAEEKSSVWAIVLAYAFELEKYPHEDFIKAAWRLNPLLTILVAENIEDLKSFRLPKVSRFIEDTVRFLQEKLAIQNDNKQQGFCIPDYLKSLIPQYRDIGILKSREFQYVFQSNYIACERLKTLKKDWYTSSPGRMSKFVETGLLKRSDVTKQNRNEFIINILRLKKISYLKVLIKNKWIIKEDFTRDVPDWVEAITLKQVKLLISASIATREKLNKRISELIKEVKLMQVKNILDLDLIDKTDFAGRIPEWINSATLKQAELLINLGFADNTDFVDRAPEWINNATLKQAEILITLGLANKTDFIDRIPEWINRATLKQAELLINLGFANNTDFVDRAPEWIKNVTLYQAEKLINLELFKKADFFYRVPEWINRATVYQAEILIRNGFANNTDFRDRVSEWIKAATPNQAQLLINLGFANKDDFCWETEGTFALYEKYLNMNDGDG